MTISIIDQWETVWEFIWSEPAAYSSRAHCRLAFKWTVDARLTTDPTVKQAATANLRELSAGGPVSDGTVRSP